MTPKKTKPEPDNKEQFARFIEAAKQVDNPNAKEVFEEALAKIVKKKTTNYKTLANSFIKIFTETIISLASLSS